MGTPSWVLTSPRRLYVGDRITIADRSAGVPRARDVRWQLPKAYSGSAQKPYHSPGSRRSPQPDFRSDAFDAVGLRAPVALAHRVADAVALLQRLGRDEDGHVHEQVGAPCVRGDEAEAALGVVARHYALA